MSNASVFATAFATISKEIEYNAAWENGTGYLDHICSGAAAPALKPAEIVKTIDPNGRRIIVIGTRFGNVAVFDRYAPRAGNSSTFVTNAPEGKKIFKFLLSGSAVGEHEMINLLGGWSDIDDNLGRKIEDIIAVLTEEELHAVFLYEENRTL